MQRSCDEIIEHPESGPVTLGSIRRRLVRRFPYAILYTIEADHILIIAVMHGHREPGYWKDRLEN